MGKVKSETLGIEIEFQAVHVGLISNEEWKHDKWIITLNGQSFDYKAGLGHRKQKIGFKSENPKDLQNALGDRLKDKQLQREIILRRSYPVAPSVDDVLYCVISDSEAGQESFKDFCGNFGYSDDSIKAFEIYRACQASAEKVRKMNLGKTIEELLEAFQDY